MKRHFFHEALEATLAPEPGSLMATLAPEHSPLAIYHSENGTGPNPRLHFRWVFRCSWSGTVPYYTVNSTAPQETKSATEIKTGMLLLQQTSAKLTCICGLC